MEIPNLEFWLEQIKPANEATALWDLFLSPEGDVMQIMEGGPTLVVHRNIVNYIKTEMAKKNNPGNGKGKGNAPGQNKPAKETAVTAGKTKPGKDTAPGQLKPKPDKEETTAPTPEVTRPTNPTPPAEQPAPEPETPPQAEVPVPVEEPNPAPVEPVEQPKPVEEEKAPEPTPAPIVTKPEEEVPEVIQPEKPMPEPVVDVPVVETKPNPKPSPQPTGRRHYDEEIPMHLYMHMFHQKGNSQHQYGELFDANMDGQLKACPSGSGIQNPYPDKASYWPIPEEANVVFKRMEYYDGEGGGSGYTVFVQPDGSHFKPVSDKPGRPDYDGKEYKQWWKFAIPEGKGKSDLLIHNGNFPRKMKFFGDFNEYQKPDFLPVDRQNTSDLNGYDFFGNWDITDKKGTRIPEHVNRILGTKNLRDYQDWSQVNPEPGVYKFNPTQEFWRLDDSYRQTKEANPDVEIRQTIKALPKYLLQRYPVSHVDKVNYRDSEHASHVYKGNFAVYPTKSSFPANGATNAADFPYSKELPTTFQDHSTQLCYDWDGKEYVLRTKNDPNVYYSVDSTGKLITLANEYLIADRKIAATYRDAGEMDFQSVARYGSNKNINLDIIKTTDKLIGLNLIDVKENGNEDSASWDGPLRYLNGEMLAAKASACFDGHMGTMGPGVGAITADPNMKFCVGGVPSSQPKFWIPFIEWVKKYRGYNPDGTLNFPGHQISVHQYFTSNGIEQHTGNNRYGVPADMDAKSSWNLQELIDFLHREVGYPIQVVIGETGYDTAISVQSVPKIGPRPFTPQTPSIINKADNKPWTIGQVIAMWTWRANLHCAWLGVYRMNVYSLEDVGGAPWDAYDTPDTLYMTSGHHGKGGSKYPREIRPAAYVLRQVSEIGKHKPVERLSDTHLKVQVAKNTVGDVTYTTWIADMVGRVEDYTLQLPGVKSITLHTVVWGSYEMKKEVIQIEGSYKLTVTELPVVITINN